MRKHQQGVTLVESVVAVLILAAGILGLAALQGRALAVSQSVFYRSIATDLAADLAERIRVNRTPFLAMQGATALEPAFATALPPNFAKCTQNGATVTCAAQDAGHQAYLVQNEMSEWNTALRDQLPNARFVLAQTAASAVATSPVSGFYRYTLTISWSDDRTSGAEFSYTTVIE